MKLRLKKAIGLGLSAWFFLSGLSVSVSAFDHHPYWALQAAYNSAAASGDDDALLKACEDIIAFYEGFPDADATYRVEKPTLDAARIYEERGLYRDALRMYKTYKDCLLARTGMVDDDVTERLLFADAFIDAYAYTVPTVYVQAENAADVPYYGAKNEPVAGTYVGMCRADRGNYDESLNSAYLLYVRFEDETISGFEWLHPYTDSYYLMEIAWNIADHYTSNGAIEYLERIANGSLDYYIIPELQYLNTLEGRGILLRFGAEVNVWEVNTQYKNSGRLEAFKQTYIAAFRRIHDLAETYAPNVAMVYSPNDISNMYVTHSDFYPGDDYVDWVGMSTYGNYSGDANGQYASMPDAYYKRGVYENQMIKMMDIVNTYGSKKPIMISECGFMYNSADGSQSAEHARKSMETFYSYVNMLYPQVKAVFYFNTNFGSNQYCLFGFGEMSDNPTLASAYTEAIRGNCVMADTLAGKKSGYTRLETLNEAKKDLNLSLYAAYPGHPSFQVEYVLDGKTAAVVDKAPYSCTIPAELFDQGTHSLQIITRVKESVYTQNYDIIADANGNMRAEKFTHMGGVATCTAPAICEICSEPYGEPNPDGHAVSEAWTASDGQHYHTCLNGCGAMLDVGACYGGMPTCIEKAKCSVCMQDYGDFAPHVPSSEISSANGQHFYGCTTVGCSETFDAASCTDGDRDHKCDICGGEVGEHKASEGAHTCAYCGETMSECADGDSDNKCDICGTKTGTAVSETEAIETEAPETEAPETEAPETEAIETEAIETEAIETEAIETEAIETNAPETDAPETDAPETEAIETEAIETNAPETDALETDAPETQAIETEAPETEAIETEAPETEAPETEAASGDSIQSAEEPPKANSTDALTIAGIASAAVLVGIGTIIFIKKKKH